MSFQEFKSYFRVARTGPDKSAHIRYANQAAVNGIETAVLQSSGIAGIQLGFALRASWHLGRSRRIYFTLSAQRAGGGIWVADSNGADAVQLTFFGAGKSGSPHRSPDGSKVVFDSNVESQFEIYGIAAAGGRPRR